jgi:hypothetical protein
LAANEASASSLALGYCALRSRCEGSRHQCHRARQLVASSARCAGVTEIVELERASLAELDDGGDGLAVLLVGDADHEAVVDGRVALDRHLHLLGVDLLAAGVDAVGAAAEQRDRLPSSIRAKSPGTE